MFINKPSERDDVDPKQEANVCKDGEKADDGDNDSLEYFCPGERIIHQMKSIILQERIVAATILQPGGGRSSS